MNKKFSVIIPVYNAEKTIRHTVDTLIQEMNSDGTILLIDDCSKDFSWQICCELAKKYENVDCFQNKKNSGVSFARNQGLDKAEGEYIFFVDSDDWVASGYIQKLLSEAESFPDELVIGGFRYIDKLEHYQRDYLWDTSGSEVSTVCQNEFFMLASKFQLQQIWNKVFLRSTIEQYHIRFNEKQSMGEDFGFVLDYMRAAGITKCRLINQCLYFYIRANRSSLMKNFGLTSIEESIERLEELADLSDRKNPETESQLQEAIDNQRKTAVYFTVRSKKLSFRSKLNNIKHIMGDRNAIKYFCMENILLWKERLSKWILPKSS